MEACDDFMWEGKRERINSQQSHHSQVIQSNLKKTYMNHDRALHIEFYKETDKR